MHQEPNFILLEGSGSRCSPTISGPDCMKDFLRLFEVYCSVGCCDWGAIDLSDDRLRNLLAAGEITSTALRELLSRMLAWTKQLPGECRVAGSNWDYDPCTGIEELEDALNRIEKIT